MSDKNLTSTRFEMSHSELIRLRECSVSPECISIAMQLFILSNRQLGDFQDSLSFSEGQDIL